MRRPSLWQTAGPLTALLTSLCLPASLALWAAPVLAGPNGVVVGEVRVTKDGAPKADRSNVVVYLENVGPTRGLRPRRPSPQIRQRYNAFIPGQLVIQKGDSVEFPNDDKVFHNVFSLSQHARFDLGLYKSGSSRTVTFNQPGVVDIFCNIHPQMVAKILVIDSPHHAVTAGDGRFRLEGIAPGTYPVVAWIANGVPARGEVVVKRGAIATVSLTVNEGRPSTHHLRKDRTPYGRYQ
jgi:hypothetical protein